MQVDMYHQTLVQTHTAEGNTDQSSCAGRRLCRHRPRFSTPPHQQVWPLHRSFHPWIFKCFINRILLPFMAGPGTQQATGPSFMKNLVARLANQSSLIPLSITFFSLFKKKTKLQEKRNELNDTEQSVSQNGSHQPHLATEYLKRDQCN